jgi:hypothetical protein
MDSPVNCGLNTFEKLAFLSTEMELEISKLCLQQSFKHRTEAEFEVLRAQGRTQLLAVPP